MGCDFKTATNGDISSLFQSTHPSGVRLERQSFLAGRGWISIHAPQWGATPPRRYGCFRQYDFNPRTPVGCDKPTRRLACPNGYFNPRTPVGCDFRAASSTGGMFLFQSTHPSGVRPQITFEAPPVSGISIHAPQWGATIEEFYERLADLFQSTHPSGVRL